MKKQLSKIKVLIFYIPTLIRFLYMVIKATLYIRKKLIKKKLLSKKKANSFAIEAFEAGFETNLDKYEDNDLYCDLVYRMNTFDWIRRYGNQSDEINEFCDSEVAEIDYEIKEGELTRKITAADFDVLEYQINEYEKLLNEIKTPVSPFTVLH